MKRGWLFAAAWLMLVLPMTAFGQSPEFRSIEITSWSSGFESPTATTTLVNYAKSCNLNAIIPEIRLRADAYYYSEIEPPGTGVTPDYGYDSLADMITKAHAQGIEVHPWLVTFRMWTTIEGPPDTSPPHLWDTHGPGRPVGADDWTMYSDTGANNYGGTVNVDPGHPAVENYLITVFMDIVNRYDVDGLNLDYIRYPSLSMGYNPVSVARFNAEYGRTGNPSSGDTTWQQWRRDQITNLVKRLYLEIKASKPWVKLSADVWNSASTGNNSYLQDWDTWMANHWIDFVHPMSYTGSNSTFTSWCNTYESNQHGRHVYPLIDVSNDITANVLPQIAEVRDGHGFSGMGLYSYQSISNKTSLKNALISGPFSSPATVPGMPWLDTPTTGYLKGFVKNTNGDAVYPSTVTITTTGASTKDTGTGFYGFVDLAPGTYTVRATAAGHNTVQQNVTITAGQCADLDFALQAETIPPVISNVRTANIQATNAQILWTTNEASTSQVDYGLTTSYGTTTTEDMVRVTSHTVQLMGLTPNTTYHYRVRSYDAMRNVAVSTDYTFTTTVADDPDDIIIDNNEIAPTFALSGSWFPSTSGTDKYGSNYVYCSISGGLKTATWRPTIVVPGNYNVYAWWPAGTNRTNNAPYFVQWNGASATYPQNQQINGGQWNLIAAAKPFATGTNGYVQVSNTNINPSVVIADAVRFEYVGPIDTTPPTAPSNMMASAVTAGQMSLSWTASTDNVGVTGYNVYRNGAPLTTVTSNSHVDVGLNYNISFSYYVKAKDAAGNLSAASNTVSKYSLSLPPGASTLTCDKPVNTWQTTPTFTFTSTGFGPGKVQYYKYAWTQDSTYTWTDYESEWNSGTLTVNASSGGSWYLHIRGYNGDDVANGSYTYGPYKYDGSEVQISDLNDGKYVSAAGQLHASWTGSDPETGVVEYQYAIGTSPENITSVRGWTSTGTTASVTTTGLTLTPNTKYYFGVKALNGGGVWSDPMISDGVTAAVAVNSIAEAKASTSGDAVILTDKVVSANFGSFFYICEDSADNRMSAIRVEGISAIEGDLTDVSGIISMRDGEYVISEPETNPESGPGAPAPVVVLGRSVGGEAITGGMGLSNVGMLVTIVGKVEDQGTGYFIINDGSSNINCEPVLIKVSTLMLTSVPTTGKMVTVTGIISAEQSGGVVTPVLIPRGDSDVPQPWYL